LTDQERWLAELIQGALAPTPTQVDRLYARLREEIHEPSHDEAVLWQSFTRLMATMGASIGQTVHAAARTPWWESNIRRPGITT
jgi:hypothetical protein